MALTNLKLSTSEQGSILGGDIPEHAEYPYGLTITLNQEVLTRLGIDEMPEVGSMVQFAAQAEVIGVNKDTVDGKTSHDVRLQITDINFSTGEKDKSQVMFPDG